MISQKNKNRLVVAFATTTFVACGGGGSSSTEGINNQQTPLSWSSPGGMQQLSILKKILF